MTADEKLKLLTAFQSKKALETAGVVLVEGTSVETLRVPNAVSPRIAIVLNRLDQARFWSESTLHKSLSLQLPKAGVQVTALSYSCLVGADYAAFVGMVSSGATLRSAIGGTSLSQASSALQDLTQSLRSDGLSLQEMMQRENQVFTSVSNVLKTRHDTVKNSISNIR